MKTIKFFSVLSLVLILAGTTAVYSGTKPTIKYVVIIHLDKNVDLCNTYLVQVMDENGNPVVHPQVYIPGTNKYIFNETPSTRVKVRIASLISLNGKAPACGIDLNTPKEMKVKLFHPGQTYGFDLYPVVVKEEILIQDGTETGINP